jgi:hypothetical protein
VPQLRQIEGMREANSELWERLVVTLRVHKRRSGGYPGGQAVKRWVTWAAQCAERPCPELQELAAETRAATAWVVCEMFRDYQSWLAKANRTTAEARQFLVQRQRKSLHFSPCQIEPEWIKLPKIGWVRFGKRWRMFEAGRASIGDGVHVWCSPTTGLWHATVRYRRL